MTMKGYKLNNFFISCFVLNSPEEFQKIFYKNILEFKRIAYQKKILSEKQNNPKFIFFILS